MSVIFDSVRFKLNCEKWRHSRGNFLADVIGGDYWKIWGGVCAYFDQSRYMIVITQLKGNLNNYVIDDDVIDLSKHACSTTILLTWYVSKGLKFWKIISEGKGWKMASSMSTFEIFWCVVSDMSISSIIVGRRMCRVSAKRWKFIFGEMEHMKNERKIPISTRKCRFWPENADFDPKCRSRNTDFRPKNAYPILPILIQKYRFWRKISIKLPVQLSSSLI